MNRSFEYNSSDINGKKSQSIKINGKDVDLNKQQDIEEAINYFKSCKDTVSNSLFCKLFNVDLHDMYDDAIEVLNSHKQKLLGDVCKDPVTDPWVEAGIDFDDSATALAYEYLKETKEGFSNLSIEDQAKHINTVADFYNWAKNSNGIKER